MIGKKSQTFAAISVLIGTMVGAGFLGIPYVVSKSGFIIGGTEIIILGLIMLFVNLLLGEVTLRTKGNHQLTGYAEKYIGKTGKTVMLFSLLFGVFSALLAYSIGISESISYIIFGNMDSTLQIGVIFLTIMAVLTFFGKKTFKEGEILGIFLMGVLLIGIVIYFTPKMELSNLAVINLENTFIPFGTILFAFLSLTALPELERILEKQKGKMKKTIIIGSLIPIIGYFFFTMVVIGSTGESVPEIATLSMGKIFVLLGITAMLTSFLALSIILKGVLHFDYRLSKGFSWGIVSFVSLALFVLTYQLELVSFTKVLNASGIISGSLTAILILIMADSAKRKGERKPEYSVNCNRFVEVLLIMIFLVGSVISLIKL